MHEITTKRKMYELVERGRFGNYPRWWRTIKEIHKAKYKGHISIRSLEGLNPVRLYHIPACDLFKVVAKLPESQRKPGLVFSESPDDSTRTIQGEWDGFYLRYTFAKLPMRLAFDKQNLHVSGPRARMILKSYLELGDYEWLDQLIEDFPGHTIEFSGFSVPVGQLNGFMFIWEVRRY